MPKVKKKKPIKKWRVVIEKFYDIIETHTYDEVKAATEEEAIAIVNAWDESGDKKPDDVHENMEFDFQNINTYLIKKDRKDMMKFLFKGRKR